MTATYRALTSFAWGQTVYREGDIVPADDPVLVKHRALFEAVPEPAVEQATAAPGERRNVTRPRRKES